jgi:methylated-DNA-[protein]-cysteine S-methyltransferase
VQTRFRTHFHLFDTALGVCGLAWSDAGITRVQLPEADDLATASRLRALGATSADPVHAQHALTAVTTLRDYLGGTRVEFDSVLLDVRGVTQESQSIYATLRRVHWGETTTYGQLAVAIGVPGAARVVGRAMARNPWPVVVPCHRVLTAQRTSGGFSAYGGASTQRRLLGLELTTIPGEAVRLPDLFD